MRCDDFDVLDLSLAVRSVVLDADVGEVDLIVDHGQVVPPRPLGDFAIERLRVTLPAPTLERVDSGSELRIDVRCG